MSNKAEGGKGAVKKKIVSKQKETEYQRKSNMDTDISMQEVYKIIGIEEKNIAWQQKPTQISKEEKMVLPMNKETQGSIGIETQNLDFGNNNLVENKDTYIFRPTESISHTLTVNAEHFGEASSKRLSSEISPDFYNTMRQCEAASNDLDNIPNSNLQQLPSHKAEDNEGLTTEVQISKIISALELIEEKTGFNADLRNATGSLNRNLTLLVYKLGLLEKENVILKHKLEYNKVETNKEVRKEIELYNNGKVHSSERTYASISSPKNIFGKSKDKEEREEWRTRETKKKHETVIKVDQITDAKKAIQELRKEINTKNTEGGFKNVRPLKNGAVVIESHSKTQQGKLIAELQNKNHITVKESVNPNPMFVVTGIEKGFDDTEFVREIIRLNNEIVDEIGCGIQSQIKVIARKQCRNPNKENVILQAPPLIVKWFLKKELINFDLVKVHVKEYFNLAMCFKCCGFGHVAKYCTSKECCHKCGGEHTGGDCTEIEWRCPNCEKMKFGELQHSARDMNCPVYKNRIERFKQNINYSDSFL